ncbi:hypothetical protein FM106_15180 [Brachybacterium faecium]|nr:hypothetical protein FM106_15180 [Brachybacterium faecium]
MDFSVCFILFMHNLYKDSSFYISTAMRRVMLRYFAGVIKVMLLTSPKGEKVYIYALSPF